MNPDCTKRQRCQLAHFKFLSFCWSFAKNVMACTHTRAMLGAPHIVQKDQLIDWKAQDKSEVKNCLSAMWNTNLHSCTGNDRSDSVLLLPSNLSLGKKTKNKQALKSVTIKIHKYNSNGSQNSFNYLAQFFLII